MTIEAWALIPLLSFAGAVLGWLVGRRKIAAEAESISTIASKTALDMLLSTVDPLRDEIRELKMQIRELKEENRKLVDENVNLQRSVNKLRMTITKFDSWPNDPDLDVRGQE